MLGIVDECCRAVMLHYGHDVAARRAQAAQVRASKTDKKADDEEARLAAAERERQMAEQLNATLALLEAAREAALTPSVLPEVVRIRDPEAAQRGMRERAARAEASRQAFRAAFPPRRQRPVVEEMRVVSGWPRIIDPEASPTEVVGYGR